MKHAPILFAILSLCLLDGIAAYAAEDATWGSVKALFNEEATPQSEVLAPAAKLTISQRRAGGYRPGSLRLSVAAIPFTNTPVEGSEGCGGPDTNTIEFLVASVEPTDFSPFGPTAWEVINCVDLDTGGVLFGNGTWISEQGTVTFTQAFQPGVPDGWLFAIHQQITGGTGAYEGAKGTAYTLGNCDFDEDGGCIGGDGLLEGWIRGFSLD